MGCHFCAIQARNLQSPSHTASDNPRAMFSVVSKLFNKMKQICWQIFKKRVINPQDKKNEIKS